ncbi:pknB [Symbiodinium pilosum]|uniref:PknB protein n=1 Tax=Symbiodinium pilosum TaxID=2952 RepID=A0A812QBH5_SYMPI|nr:pknB [Symbiodinium pilosum]
MKEADGAEVMLGLLSALAHVHSLGIVHRDVKCENILIAENRAVLADFGIAASLNDAKAMEKMLGYSKDSALPATRARHPGKQRAQRIGAKCPASCASKESWVSWLCRTRSSEAWNGVCMSSLSQLLLLFSVQNLRVRAHKLMAAISMKSVVAMV